MSNQPPANPLYATSEVAITPNPIGAPPSVARHPASGPPDNKEEYEEIREQVSSFSLLKCYYHVQFVQLKIVHVVLKMGQTLLETVHTFYIVLVLYHYLLSQSQCDIILPPSGSLPPNRKYSPNNEKHSPRKRQNRKGLERNSPRMRLGIHLLHHIRSI